MRYMNYKKNIIQLKSGLSLMEVLFAIAILATVLLAVGNGFDKSATSSVSARNQILAMEDTKRILEQVRMVADSSGLATVKDQDYWSNVNGNGWLQTTTFSNLTGATHTIVFPDGTTQDPLHVRANVNWQEKNGTRSYSLDTLVTNRA